MNPIFISIIENVQAEINFHIVIHIHIIFILVVDIEHLNGSNQEIEKITNYFIYDFIVRLLGAHITEKLHHELVNVGVN